MAKGSDQKCSVCGSYGIYVGFNSVECDNPFCEKATDAQMAAFCQKAWKKGHILTDSWMEAAAARGFDPGPPCAPTELLAAMRAANIVGPGVIPIPDQPILGRVAPASTPLEIHGIVLDDDYYGEPINFGGLDVSRCDAVVAQPRDGGAGWNISDHKGRLVEIRKVLRQADCQSDYDLRLLALNNGAPFVRASARLLIDTSFYEGCIQERVLRWSAEGHILERDRGIARATLSLVRLGCGPSLPKKFTVFPGLG